MKIKTISGLVFLLVAGATQLAYADSTTNWSGCYAGGNLGYGFAKIDGVNKAPPPSAIGSATPNGAALGLQSGCDRQNSNLVWGAQLSLNAADMTGDSFYIGGSGPSNRIAYKITSLATLTGRVGYLVNPSMLAYMKAGLAQARTKHEDTDPAPTAGLPYSGNATATREGWLLGVGAERAISGNLSLYVEYNHMDFGSKDVLMNYSDAGTSWSTMHSFKQRIDYLAFGANYRF